MRITVNNRIATRVDDDWSKSIRNEVVLSAYPLALWIVSSWWRLLYEPAPDGIRSTGWRMAHELASAGHGFLWPRLVFESDGETVDVVSHRSGPDPCEPVRYIEEFREPVPLKQFESTIEGFISLTLSRLDSVGLPAPDLAGVWEEVQRERSDPDACIYRRLEARLGFDPDEAPQDAVQRLLRLTAEAGEAAVAEIAPACAGTDAEQAVADVVKLAQSPGFQASTEPSGRVSALVSTPEFRQAAPWERGRWLATQVRDAWHLGMDRLDDATLAQVLAMDIAGWTDPLGTPSVPHRLGLAVRTGVPGRVKLVFRRRNRPGRRFEAARFLADNLAAPQDDRWLPATDSKTARQKFQRAFAAEFLCPVRRLEEYLGDDYTDEAISDAGEYFGVSPLAVRSHLANNGLLPRF
jgi:hypothetical protein